MTKGTTSNAKQKKTSASQRASEIQQVNVDELRAKLDECLCQATGIQSPEVVHQIWSEMARMQVGGEDWLSRYTAAFHMISELKPANATEALLAVQMVGIHEAALIFLKRAMHKEQTEEGCDANVLRSTRCMRIFKEQAEVMMKLKGKATQQKVTVEHVHVHAGAQAVVGVVKAPEGEGGAGVSGWWKFCNSVAG